MSARGMTDDGSGLLDPEPGYAALIIDVVGSREAGPRRQLQDDLRAATQRTNDRVPPVDPLAITVGDELQGTYASLPAAVVAAVYFRLTMIQTGADVRAAIGWGDIVVHDPSRSPLAQDGPAWWEAREVMDAIAASTSWTGYAARLGVGPMVRPEPRGSTPAVKDAAGVTAALPPPQPDTSNAPRLWAALVPLIDHAVGQLTANDARIVVGDFDDRSTAEIREATGLSESSISSRRSRGQLREVVAALRALDPERHP